MVPRSLKIKTGALVREKRGYRGSRKAKPQDTVASKKAKPRPVWRSRSKVSNQVVDLTESTFFVDSGDSLLDPTKDFPERVVKRCEMFGIIQQDGTVVLHGTFEDCALYMRDLFGRPNRLMWRAFHAAAAIG